MRRKTRTSKSLKVCPNRLADVATLLFSVMFTSPDVVTLLIRCRDSKFGILLLSTDVTTLVVRCRDIGKNLLQLCLILTMSQHSSVDVASFFNRCRVIGLYVLSFDVDVATLEFDVVTLIPLF